MANDQLDDVNVLRRWNGRKRGRRQPSAVHEVGVGEVGPCITHVARLSDRWAADDDRIAVDPGRCGDEVGPLGRRAGCGNRDLGNLRSWPQYQQRRLFTSDCHTASDRFDHGEFPSKV